MAIDAWLGEWFTFRKDNACAVLREKPPQRLQSKKNPLGRFFFDRKPVDLRERGIGSMMARLLATFL